jgi:NADH:ubiquinone oxidoreductase subunit F (NADH-binding)
VTTSGAAAGLPRLLRGYGSGEPIGLAAHLASHGPLPDRRSLPARRLIEDVEQAGLRGRGGAAFPTARKLRAVRSARGRPIVVANGCESEPLSLKDALLMRELPHLVLDGAELAARAVGADEVIVAHAAANTMARAGLESALAERGAAGLGPTAVELVPVSDRFLAGQETALVSQLGGGPPRPTFVPPRPADRGVRRRPTLIQNVETLAQLALIARHGPGWYRALGTADEPGSRFVTVAGAVEAPGVFEIECGTTLAAVLAAAGGSNDDRGLLIGGYFGSWLPAGLGGQIELGDASLARWQAALGCGAVFVLPDGACPVAETVRVAVYLATETAGQCGPCVHGTAAIARTLHGVSVGRPPRGAFADLERWTRELPGRGACHHPNGLANFVATSLRVFAEEFVDHARLGPCDGCAATPALPIPETAVVLG